MITGGSRDWGVAASDFAEGFRLALRCGVPLLLTATLLMLPFAHAQAVTGGTDPTTILNNIASFILGPFGQALAVLSVIGIGAAFIFGRVTIGLLAGLVGGLVLIFGASYLVTQFVGGGGTGAGG